MTVIRTLGAVCAAALITVSGAAYAGNNTHPPPPPAQKNKVEIYIKVKSGAEADVDYVTKKHHQKPRDNCEGAVACDAPPLAFTQLPNGHPTKKGKQEIKEETAKVWGEAKVDIEAKGVTSGTFDTRYDSHASTHNKSASTEPAGAQSASSSTGGGGGGCGCNSSTTSASTSGGASGSWSTGGGG